MKDVKIIKQSKYEMFLTKKSKCHIFLKIWMTPEKNNVFRCFSTHLKREGKAN